VVTVPIERFRLAGTPARYVKQAASGNRGAQVCCPHCGSHLVAAAAEHPTRWHADRTRRRSTASVGRSPQALPPP